MIKDFLIWLINWARFFQMRVMNPTVSGLNEAGCHFVGQWEARGVRFQVWLDLGAPTEAPESISVPWALLIAVEPHSMGSFLSQQVCWPPAPQLLTLQLSPPGPHINLRRARHPGGYDAVAGPARARNTPGPRRQVGGGSLLRSE